MVVQAAQPLVFNLGINFNGFWTHGKILHGIFFNVPDCFGSGHITPHLHLYNTLYVISPCSNFS